MNASTLEQMLDELHTFGRPRVFCDEDGWCVSVKLNTTHIGASVEIRSRFSLPSPRVAATECLDRVRAAMKPTPTPTAIEAKP